MLHLGTNNTDININIQIRINIQIYINTEIANINIKNQYWY